MKGRMTYYVYGYPTQEFEHPILGRNVVPSLVTPIQVWGTPGWLGTP
jgi:hypothetical protein